MNEYVTDTHALYWYLAASPRLGAQAKQVFEEAANGQARIYVPAIVLAEFYYMNVKLGRPLDFIAVVGDLQEGSQFVLLPFEPEDTLEFDTDQAVSEMHDRMIAGVARRLNAVLITRDTQITGSGVVATIW